MGATRNTGYLENLIQYDASDNVAIATSVNPSYKVTLGGSLLGTSAVFSSTVTSSNEFRGLNGYGIRSYTAATATGNNILFAASVFASFDGIYQSSGSTNDFGIWTNGGTINQPKFVIKNAGNVGIGTTSPNKGGVNRALTLNAATSTNASYELSVNDILQGSLYTAISDTSVRLANFNSGDIVFVTGATSTERMRIRSGGEISFIPTTWTYVNPNTTYRNMDIGAAGWLYRDAVDAYLLSNHYYNSSGQNIAKYSYSEGIGAFAIAGGNLTWYSYGASVTAGSNYATTPRFTVTYTGNVGVATTDPKEKFEIAAAFGNIRLYGRNGINLNNVSNNIYYNGSSWVRDNGSYGAQKIVFDTDGDLFFETTSSTSGDTTPRMTITSGGNVGIGTTNPLCLLQAGGIGNSAVRLGTSSTTNTSASTAFGAWNSSGQDLLTIRGDGLVAFAKINDFTTSNSPNTWINPNSSWGIYINTSSIRYKKDVVDYDKGIDIVSQLRPVYYKGKSEVDGDKQFAGFIAEEIDELGLTEFVNYIEDGRPNSLSYPNMVALLTKAIQEQQAQIEELKSKLA